MNYKSFIEDYVLDIQYIHFQDYKRMLMGIIESGEIPKVNKLISYHIQTNKNICPVFLVSSLYEIQELLSIIELIVELKNEPMVYLRFNELQLQEFFEAINREKWETADEFTENANRILAGRELGKKVIIFFIYIFSYLLILQLSPIQQQILDSMRDPLGKVYFIFINYIY